MKVLSSRKSLVSQADQFSGLGRSKRLRPRESKRSEGVKLDYATQLHESQGASGNFLSEFRLGRSQRTKKWRKFWKIEGGGNSLQIDGS
jgi:hypothetical protein